MTRSEYESLQPLVREIRAAADQDSHTIVPDIYVAARIIKALRKELEETHGKLSEAGR